MMNEDALRAIVRDAIARVAAREIEPPVSETPHLLHPATHPSSYEYTLPPSDGPCMIEPGVACNHCGYCRTHGH